MLSRRRIERGLGGLDGSTQIRNLRKNPEESVTIRKIRVLFPAEKDGPSRLVPNSRPRGRVGQLTAGFIEVLFYRHIIGRVGYELQILVEIGDRFGALSFAFIGVREEFIGIWKI